jgi:hypothetical protein
VSHAPHPALSRSLRHPVGSAGVISGFPGSAGRCGALSSNTACV